jgi:hypothetical protein
MSIRASREHHESGHDAQGASGAALAPGKRTLSEELGGGEGLPDAPRSTFEKSLGRDLSGVRVHTSDAAASAAQRVDAHAYASGQDIVFARGAYNPFDRRSMQLLAHEVAHTAQQQGAAPSGDQAGNVTTTQPGDPAERDADAAASAMMTGRPAQVAAQPIAIARKRQDESLEEPSTPPAGGAGAPGAPGEDDEQIGELTADRVGQVPDEGEDVGPDVPVRDPEAGKQDIAAAGQQLPPDGGAEEAGGLAAPGDANAGGGDAGGEGGEISPELQASVGEAQSDAREAITESEAESAAYKAEMAAAREKFEAEQHATMLESLKTMSSVEKRQTLQEMGYDPKKVKKMKDAEIDGIIQGKFEAEARKTKILGMTPEELAALSADRKIQYLVDLGIDRKDLDKAGRDKATRLFDDIMKVAHVPGQHKVKIQIKGGLLGKSWEVTVKCDAEGNTDIQAQEKGGFLSKLWGWVKLALPIILTVLAPLTAGVSLIVLGVYQAAMAIKNGDWLGAVLGAVTALGGLSTFMTVAKGASAAAATFTKIADVAKKVQKVAQAAQAAMTAAKAKNAGSLLGALAQGAAAFAAFSGNAAGKFAQTMTKWAAKLEKWSKVLSGGQRVVQGIKSGDTLAAFGGAFDAVAAAVGDKTPTGQALTRASKITGLVSAGRAALGSDPPNYPAVAEAALGIAGQLKEDRRLDDAAQIVSRANRLKQAWDNRAKDPAALIQAALGLAEAIQVAKYDLEHDEKKDGDGKPVPDDERTQITTRYQRAGNIVRSASALIKAATAKPRPSYVGALDAATQLIAELTDNKQIDAAAVVTARLDAWTKAVNSKNEKAIFEAGLALGQAIDGLRTVIAEEHASAKKAAQAQLGPGETLPDDGGDQLPPGPSDSDLAAAAAADDAQGDAADDTATSEDGGPSDVSGPNVGDADQGSGGTGGQTPQPPPRPVASLGDSELGSELGRNATPERQRELEDEIDVRMVRTSYPQGSAGSPPTTGTTQVSPDVAIKILENVSRGEPPFRPELGKGGASWFVTEGNPYTGIDPVKSVPIEVEIARTARVVRFGESELVQLHEAAISDTAAESEAAFRKRFGLQAETPLNAKLRKSLRRFQERFAESRMWDKVAQRVAASPDGVGEVVLQNSKFSVSGNGKFAVVTDPAKLQVKGGVEVLLRSLEGQGVSAEAPLREAAEALARKQQWAGRVRGVFRYGGRVLIVVGVAADVYKVYHAKDKVKAVVESAGGWAGATAAAAAFAAWFAPADVAGPWAWAAHGVGTLIAGGVGYWVGSATTRTIYELVVED